MTFPLKPTFGLIAPPTRGPLYTKYFAPIYANYSELYWVHPLSAGPTTIWTWVPWRHLYQWHGAWASPRRPQFHSALLILLLAYNVECTAQRLATITTLLDIWLSCLNTEYLYRRRNRSRHKHPEIKPPAPMPLRGCIDSIYIEWHGRWLAGLACVYSAKGILRVCACAHAHAHFRNHGPTKLYKWLFMSYMDLALGAFLGRITRQRLGCQDMCRLCSIVIPGKIRRALRMQRTLFCDWVAYKIMYNVRMWEHTFRIQCPSFG